MDISGGDFGEKPDGFDTLKINKDFASRFEHNAKRKFLEKGKAKYGKDLDAPFSSSESSSSEDDSDAELLNPRVEKKFLEVLTAIRTNDPKLKKTDKPLFEDADFESDGKTEKKKTDKAFTLKDQIRTDALKKMKNNESAESGDDADFDEKDIKKQRHAKETNLFTKIGRTLKDEEDQIKRDFKTQVSVPENSFLLKLHLLGCGKRRR